MCYTLGVELIIHPTTPNFNHNLHIFSHYLSTQLDKKCFMGVLEVVKKWRKSATNNITEGIVMENKEKMCCCLTDEREVLKVEILKLLDEIPLERVKALYIKALTAKSLM